MKDDSFDSEAPSGESFDDENETKNQTDKEKSKNKIEDSTNLDLNLIISISKTLLTILEENKKLPNYKDILKLQNKMIFSASTIPNISIKDYLIRIQTYSEIQKSTLIIGLILIDHICKNAELILTYYNIHRIIFGAILVSIKFNEDKFYDNIFYAEIAGIKPKELKLIELAFLDLVEFKIAVKFDEYEQYQKYLEEKSK